MEAGLSGRRKLEQLVRSIAPGSKLLRAWPLRGGLSAEMTAFDIEGPQGQTRRLTQRQPSAATLRRNPGAAKDEFRVLQATWSAGLATPRPLHLDETGTNGAGPFLVIEYVEGQPEFAPADLGDFIRQFAQQLALIHGVDVSSVDMSFLPPQALASAAQPATVDTALEQRGLREALAAAGPLRQQNAKALLHGDYWPGNVLWRDGQLAAVIDWEDAAVGDPLADLAISRLDVLCLFGAEATRAFTQHYQSSRAIDHGDLPYWDLCAALRLARLAGTNLAEWAAFFQPFGRGDITEHTLREHYGYFVEQALGNLVV